MNIMRRTLLNFVLPFIIAGSLILACGKEEKPKTTHERLLESTVYESIKPLGEDTWVGKRNIENWLIDKNGHKLIPLYGNNIIETAEGLYKVKVNVCDFYFSLTTKVSREYG